MFGTSKAVKQVKGAYAVIVNDSIVKMGDSRIIAKSFGVSPVEDRFLQARLIKDSLGGPVKVRALTLRQLSLFEKRAADSSRKLVYLGM